MSEISQTEHFEPHPLQLSDKFVDKLESITARKAEVATDIIETEKTQETEKPAPKQNDTNNDEEVVESPKEVVIVEQDRDQVEETELPKISDTITPEFIEKLESITAGQAEVVEQLNEAEGDEEKKVLAPPPISSNAPPAPPPPASKSSSSTNNAASVVLEELTKQNKNLTKLVEKSLNATGVSSGTGNEAELQKQITELKRALEEERAAHAATKQLSSAPVFIQGSEFSESSPSHTSALEGSPLALRNLYTVVKPKKHAFFLPSWVIGLFRLATVLWIFFVVKLTKIVSVNILRTDKDEFNRYLQ